MEIKTLRDVTTSRKRSWRDVTINDYSPKGEISLKTSWREVSINDYNTLVDRLKDDTLTPHDIQVIKVAFITGKPEDEVWNMNLSEFNLAITNAQWMDSFIIEQCVKFTKLKLAGNDYVVDTNLQNFTVAQYIDFQTFYPQRKANNKVISNILACVIIPKGHKYGEGYDIQQLVTTISEELDIMTANEIMFFFLKQYLISIRATANYFNWAMKKMKKKVKNKEKMEKLEQSWEQMKKATLAGLRSWTE